MLLGAAAPLRVVQPHVDAALSGVVRLLLIPRTCRPGDTGGHI
jgi:hypothetical protein